ncbi:hypothetical protein GALMADRAFT_144531 [Galerina marginata CBS 339.88]|uniref:CxC1-like cysteine cluster associated with KDZ transposases domain-containing protein n=1 Tax=Galerina marginata (strain CBS 339.88) TaxID=685588 RepID=A0A067SKS4_GALM3|nr:hypothetical protein GALMADRAFT_144531 [Galerina marginata CBS 339.88]
MPSAPSRVRRRIRGKIPQVSHLPVPGDLVHETDWVAPRRPQGVPGAGFPVMGRIRGPGGIFYQVPSIGGVPIDVDALDTVDGEEGSGSDTGGPGAVGDDVIDGLVDDQPEDPAKKEKGQQDPVQTRKRQKQWAKWSTVIIPKMLGPYVTLLQETQSLRDMSVVASRVFCEGCDHGRPLEVSSIYFDRIKKIVLCTCKEPALPLQWPDLRYL